MNETTKICPICPRGEEYAKTGIMPKQENDHHHHGHPHGQRLQFEKTEQQLIM